MLGKQRVRALLYIRTGFYTSARAGLIGAFPFELLFAQRELPEKHSEKYFAQRRSAARGGAPAEFAAFIRAESENCAKVVKLSGAKVD